MKQDIGTGIVRFRNRHGDLAGHGVLVDDTHVATCAHVINAAIDRPLDSLSSAIGQIVRLEFPSIAQFVAAPPERLARVDRWEPPGTSWDGVDVAGLTLVNEPRPSAATPMPLASESQEVSRVLLYGAPEGRRGAWVKAQLSPSVTGNRQQIEKAADGAFTAAPGFSGTPVVDEATGSVLGLLVAVAPKGIDYYAIPLASLKSAWPEVLSPVPPSPFKGFHAFESDDRDLFFGRTATVDQLVAEVAVNMRGLVPVIGSSGVGKTSVVYAGLLPRLTELRSQAWRVLDVRPRPTLLRALAARFKLLSGEEDLKFWQDRIIEDGLAGAANFACELGKGKHLVLVVDQFEEAASQDCGPLLRQIAEVADNGQLTVVLVLREDSVGAFCARDRRFGRQLLQNAVEVRGMTQAELEEAVRRPAKLRGIQVYDGLVHELVGALHGRPGALPLLEFLLDQMWRTLQPGERGLSFDTYERIGRLNGALAAHADRVLNGLDQADQAVVRRLFVTRLMSAERSDDSRVVERSECPADWKVIVRLANDRLLVIGRDDDGNETAEVVHEALLSAWGTLRKWLDDEMPFRNWRKLLASEMKALTGPGREAELLTGTLLGTSEQWLAEREADLTPSEIQFIKMSLTRRAEEEQRYRTLYHNSLARRLTSAAETADDPVLALLFAIEALEQSPDSHSDRLVRSCLRRAGAAEIGKAKNEDDKREDEAAFARARRRLTACDWSSDPDTAKNRLRLASDGAEGIAEVLARYGTTANDTSDPDPFIVAAYSQAGVACLGTEGGRIEVWSSGGNETRYLDLGKPITCLAVSDQAQILAVACDDNQIHVLRAEDLEPVTELAFEGFVRDLDVGPDQLVAALGHHGRIRVWRPEFCEPVCEPTADGDASRLAVSGRGDWLVVGDTTPIGRVPLSPQALAERVRDEVKRDLTREERRRYIGEDSG